MRQPLNDRNPHACGGNRRHRRQRGRGQRRLPRDGRPQGAEYRLSCTHEAAAFTGPLPVSLQTGAGDVIAESKIEGLGSEWKQFEPTLKAGRTEPAAGWSSPRPHPPRCGWTWYRCSPRTRGRAGPTACGRT